MTASEFPQKDIDKCKECQTKESTKKIYLGRKKRKAWNWAKQLQKPVTLTEGLAATDKSYNRWPFSQGSSVADVWRNSKCGSLSSFPPMGLYKQILNSPYFLILLIHNKRKIIRSNFGLTPRFYSLENELTNWDDKAKNV